MTGGARRPDGLNLGFQQLLEVLDETLGLVLESLFENAVDDLPMRPSMAFSFQETVVPPASRGERSTDPAMYIWSLSPQIHGVAGDSVTRPSVVSLGRDPDTGALAQEDRDPFERCACCDRPRAS